MLLECFWIRGYSNGPLVISSIAVITDEPAGMVHCWDKKVQSLSRFVVAVSLLLFCSYVVQKRLHMFLCKKLNIFKGCELNILQRL